MPQKMTTPINLKHKFSLFSDHWSPKVIAEVNDYQIKLVKIQGHFAWHEHKHTDEVFIVVEGVMNIEFRDRTVKLCKGEMIVVQKGVEHKPFANDECSIIIIEPRGVVNTGEMLGELTAENDVWV